MKPHRWMLCTLLAGSLTGMGCVAEVDDDPDGTTIIDEEPDTVIEDTTPDAPDVNVIETPDAGDADVDAPDVNVNEAPDVNITPPAAPEGASAPPPEN
jgi:hypothetical protein